jgi:hypothetical protein
MTALEFTEKCSRLISFVSKLTAALPHGPELRAIKCRSRKLLKFAAISFQPFAPQQNLFAERMLAQKLCCGTNTGFPSLKNKFTIFGLQFGIYFLH